MLMLASAFHYGTVVFTVVLNGLGVALGQGRIGSASLRAGSIQPAALPDISRNTFIAFAFIETSGLLALTISIILMAKTDLMAANALYVCISQLGILVCVGVVGLVVSLASSIPASNALFAYARQPFFTNKIFLIMIITMSFLQTPIVFGVIIAFMVHGQAGLCSSVADGIRLAAAAACVGIGALGPTIGQGLFAGSACRAVGVNRTAYKQIFNFCVLGLPIIETPLLLALLVSFLILGAEHDPIFLRIVALACAAGVTAVGTLMPGISSGLISSAACTQIGLHPDRATSIMQTSLLAQIMLDTSAILAFVVGIILMAH